MERKRVYELEKRVTLLQMTVNILIAISIISWNSFDIAANHPI